MKTSKKYNKDKTYCISKTQNEVWEMKERIYDSVKHIPVEKALYQILKRSMNLTNELIKERKITI